MSLGIRRTPPEGRARREQWQQESQLILSWGKRVGHLLIHLTAFITGRKMTSHRLIKTIQRRHCFGSHWFSRAEFHPIWNCSSEGEARAKGNWPSQFNSNSRPPKPTNCLLSVSIIIHIHLNLEANSQAGTSAGDVLGKEDTGDPKSKLMESQDGKQSQKPGKRIRTTSRRIAVFVLFNLCYYWGESKSKISLRLLGLRMSHRH